MSHDVLPALSLGVTPGRTDGAGHVVGALLRVVDVALVDAHEVGIHVEVVGVVVAAVDVGQSAHHLARGGPHLRHVALLGRGRAGHEAVPHHHLLALAAHVVGHGLQEVGIGYPHLVTANVDVGGVGEDLDHFIENLLQGFHALVGLHGEAHGIGEHVAVAGHVDFGNDGHAALSRISLQLATLFLRVIVAGVANHVFVGRELRVSFHLKAPGQLLRQVPVEDVHLEARQLVDFVFQLIEGNERTAHIVHEATHLEGGPVLNGQCLQTGRASLIGSLCQLVEGLGGADDTGGCQGLDVYGIGGDVKLVGLIGEQVDLVVEGPGNARDQIHRHLSLCRFAQCTAVVFQHHAQIGAVRRVA